MNFFIIFSILLILFVPGLSSAQSHLLVKSDFNNDGIADRTVFASHGISGFIQSTQANKKIDTIFLKQGNRSIFFTSNVEDGSPFVKLTEETGLYSVITLMKYENKSFIHTATYIEASEVYFSDDFFSDSIVAEAGKNQTCTPNDAFNNKATTEILSWADALKKNSLEETIKKSIDPSCKKVFGQDYLKLEKDIVDACKLESSPNTSRQNPLISCLDKNKGTRLVSGFYQQTLASNVFEPAFNINCQELDKNVPKASFNKSTKSISIYQHLPAEKNRNFKADFFHEIIHSTGIKSDQKVEQVVENCLSIKSNKNTSKVPSDHFYVRNLNEEIAKKKDGIEISVPSQAKEVSQRTISATMSEGAKTLDADFSTNDGEQYNSISKISKATFKSFDPVMKAAYEAAVPVAFAQNTIASSKTTSSVSIPTTKITVAASNRGIASTTAGSGITYDVSSFPESVSASTKGDLGNGMAIKASEVAFDSNAARSPANTEVATASATGGGSVGGSGSTRSIAGSLASIKTTDRPDLRANVPQLKAEEDFLKTLTTGKYDEVKAKLVDPKNQRILEEKKIQYVAKDKTLGSKQPVIILKDLGNKFTVLRVNVE